jgi:hypothetical protein
MLYFPSGILFKFFFGKKFNISENNIMSVQAAKQGSSGVFQLPFSSF